MVLYIVKVLGESLSAPYNAWCEKYEFINLSTCLMED